MSHSREFGSESSHRNVRKRPRDDYEGKYISFSTIILINPPPPKKNSSHLHILDGQRYFPKRGRFSDPGPSRREEALSPKQRLESIISRLGEKVFS